MPAVHVAVMAVRSLIEPAPMSMFAIVGIALGAFALALIYMDMPAGRTLFRPANAGSPIVPGSASNGIALGSIHSIIALIGNVVVIIATAVIAHAQFVNVIGGDTRLRDLIDDIAARMVVMPAIDVRGIARHPQHAPAQHRMHADVGAQRANQRIERKTRHQADRRLDAQNLRHLRKRHMLRDEHGEHLVRRGKKNSHKCAQRDDATGIERRRHGGKPALGHQTQHGADGRPRGARVLDRRVHALARHMLDRLEHKVGQEEKRDERERVLARVEHDIENEIHGEKPFRSFAEHLCEVCL